MYKQGAIVLIPFPFTDLSGNKIRPALIVGKKVYGDDVIVAFISSIVKERSKNDVVIEPNQKNGLKTSSCIKCTKIATLDTKMIIGEIGVLTAGELSAVKIILKSIFF